MPAMRLVALFFVTECCLLRTRAQPHYVDLDDPPSLDTVEDTLKYVFILARGGSRTPIFDPFPKDTAKWKLGKGELLEHGKRLMTALGRSLYSRYGEVMRHSQSKAWSVSCDHSHRTNQSAAILAAELFRDNGYTVNDGFSSMDKSQMISRPDLGSLCPGYTRERTRTWAWGHLNSDITAEDHDNDIHGRAAEIKRLTGLEGNVSRLDLMKVWDSLYMQRVAPTAESGQPSPAWAEELMRWKDLTDETYDFVTGGDRYLTQDFTAGPLFDAVLRQFAAPGGDLGIHVHVSHSLFLAAVLSSLGLQMFTPHVGTALCIELHEHDQVRVVLYQPLDWDRPGELHQARGRSPLVTALQGLCHDWDFPSDLFPYTCPLDRFRAKLPIVDPQEWQRRCAQVG